MYRFDVLTETVLVRSPKLVHKQQLFTRIYI